MVLKGILILLFGEKVIKISKLADYAVVVLAALAKQDAASASAADLSIASGLPAPTVAKVLKALAKGGIVTGARGAQGGYTLARAPDAITITHIITAVDGPINVTECADEAAHCMVSAVCSLHGRWAPVNRALIGALNGVSLADVMNTPSSAIMAGAA